MACQQLLVLLVLAAHDPAVALPGYWHLPAHTCTSPRANATTLACCGAVPKGAAAASLLAGCCDADPGCGGFTVPDGAPKGLGCSTSTTKNSAGCTTIVCASNDLCKAPGSTCGCDCGGGKTCCGMGGGGNDTRSGLYIKSSVPQKSGAQPTKPQLDWQAREVGAFVSWTIEEHCGKLGDGPNDFPNCWKNTPGTCQAVQGANNGVCLSRFSCPTHFLVQNSEVPGVVNRPQGVCRLPTTFQFQSRPARFYRYLGGVDARSGSQLCSHGAQAALWLGDVAVQCNAAQWRALWVPSPVNMRRLCLCVFVCVNALHMHRLEQVLSGVQPDPRPRHCQVRSE